MADENATGAGPFSYAELGVRLGLTPDGARTRAKRQGWRVIHGNDGRSRVIVPPAELPPVKLARPAEQKPATPGDEAAVTELARVHAERVAELTSRATAAEHIAELWRSKAELTGREAERDRAQLELVRTQAERAERRADELAAELRELRRPWLLRILAGLRR